MIVLITFLVDQNLVFGDVGSYTAIELRIKKKLERISQYFYNFFYTSYLLLIKPPII